MTTFRPRIAPGSVTPIYQQIVDQVRAAVARGELAEGEPLPSVRALADELVVNVNTVAKAYGELVRRGDAVSEPGRGVFVAAGVPRVPEAERRRGLAAAAGRMAAEAVRLGASRDEMLEALEDHCDRAGLLPRAGAHPKGGRRHA